MKYEWLSKKIDFVVLDIETTGLDKYYDEIIEIGAIKYSNGKVIEELSFFIKPTIEVPTFIKQLTHITNKQLSSGKSLKDGLLELIDFIEDKPLVCHNSEFDILFIEHKLIDESMRSIRNLIYDTFDLSRIFLPYLNNHKLNTVADFFEIENESSHRAISDAKTTGQLFIKLLDFIQKNTSLPINNHLLHISDRAKIFSDITDILQELVSHIRRNALLKGKDVKYQSPYFNIIENKKKTSKNITIDDCFDEDGLFATSIPNYELRKGQIEMSKAV
ncbi:MAG: exonuclease domain-containing protein, partial [Candidatus Cloacimonadota bacterium]|nr:exonuclease domain-containing protein [Candidatus Cloacimonadota bacterium]